MTETTELLLERILFGFGLYSLLLLVLQILLSESKKRAIHAFDDTACLTVAFAGVIYLLFWSFQLVVQFHFSEESTVDRFTGPYWFGLFAQPILFSSSQLLWLKSVRTKHFMRFIIALFLILSIEDMVIFLTSLHRDYLPSSWSVSFLARIQEAALSLGVFGIFAAIVHVLRRKISVK